MKKLLLISLFAVLAVVFVSAVVAVFSVLSAVTGSDQSAGSTSPSTSSQAWKVMAGNGTHPMGGMDGKNWGVWTATPPTPCEWSIRAVRTYAAGEILNEGSAEPGVPVRVNIQADGNVGNAPGIDPGALFVVEGPG